jgi:GNAT superfamily N-acetyltransferase
MATKRRPPVVQVRHEFSIISEKNETVASATVEHMNGVLWLTNVWVHYEHRRRGYARMVIAEALREFGEWEIWLKIHPYTDRPLDEPQLAAFYESFGFAYAGAPGIMCRRGAAYA